MELTTIDVAKDRARDLARQYRGSVKRGRERDARRVREDRSMARAYAALAKGTPLIRLSEAIIGGGVYCREDRTWQGHTETFVLPRIAVARADGEYAWTGGVDQRGRLEIRSKREVAQHNKRDRIILPRGTFEEHGGADPGWWDQSMFNSLIPPVPPPFRPQHSLSNYHILWEAEWERAPGPPPGDPALLKHVDGDLYAVLAVWDLTEVEQAVLSGRPLA